MVREISYLCKQHRGMSMQGLRPEFSAFRDFTSTNNADTWPIGAGLDAPNYLPAGSVIVVLGAPEFVAPSGCYRD